MISEKQLKANIVNAKKGGVKTEQGKNLVKQNSTKHGLTAKRPINEHEKQCHLEIVKGLKRKYNAVDVIDEFRINRLAFNLMRHEKLIRTENTDLAIRYEKEITKQIEIDSKYIKEMYHPEFFNNEKDVAKCASCGIKVGKEHEKYYVYENDLYCTTCWDRINT